jgi:hypothetical protein
MRATGFALATVATLATIVGFDAACTIMNDRTFPTDAGKRRDPRSDGGGGDDDDDIDSGVGPVTLPPVDGGCDPVAPFVDMGVGPFARIDTADDEAFTRLSEDELSVYYSREEGNGNGTILTASRASVDAPFDAPTRIELGSPTTCCGAPSPDGRRLYYAQYILVGSNPADDIYSIMVADRPGKEAVFTNPRPVLQGDTNTNFSYPHVVLEGNVQRMYFSRATKTTTTMFTVALDPNTGLSVGTPVELANVNTNGLNLDPTPSQDGLTLYFYSDVDNEQRGEIFVSRRTSISLPFSAPAHVPEIVRPTADGWVSPGFISNDACRLYYYQADSFNGPADMRMATRARSATR